MIKFNKEIYITFLYECPLALFFIDITSQASFTSVQNVLQQIENEEKLSGLTKTLVINKTDIKESPQENMLDVKNIQDFAAKNKLEIFEISALNSTNIEQLCEHINNICEDVNLPLNSVKEIKAHKAKEIPNQNPLSLILIGDSRVGKTSFMYRYFNDQFSESFMSTFGVNREVKYFQVGKENYKMTLWDTAGQEKYRFLPRQYYKNAEGIFLLFDVTDRDTFEHVSNWVSDVKDNAGSVGDKKGIRVYLVGNKIDLPERKVDKKEAEDLAKSLGVQYFEVSCKINMNIPEVICKMILDCIGNPVIAKNNGVKLKKNSTNKNNQNSDSKGCC